MANRRSWCELYNTVAGTDTGTSSGEKLITYQAFRRGGSVAFSANEALDTINIPASVSFFRATVQGSLDNVLVLNTYIRTGTIDGLYGIQQKGSNNTKFSFCGPISPTGGSAQTLITRLYTFGGTPTINAVTPYGGFFVEDMSDANFCVLRGPIGSSQSLSASTNTKVNLPNTYCQNGSVDFLSGVTTGHFNIPSGVSLVEISAGTPITTATSARHIGGRITINGTAVSYDAFDNNTSTGSALVSSIVTPVTPGDEIQIEVRSESAETLGNGGSLSPWASIVDLTDYFA